jgi:hypothetical protein
MKECKECELSFESHSQYANHIRWKHRSNTHHGNSLTKSEWLDKRFGKQVTENRTCSCGAEFRVSYREKSSTPKKKFCSRSCANSRGKRSNLVRDRIRKALKKQAPDKECPVCHEEFSSKKKQQIYCSNSCRGISQRKRDLHSLNGYRAECQFRFSLKDYPEEFDFTLIEKYGWYSASNRGGNLKGVTRDHIVSVAYGFENNLDPKLISHPANCQLMLHGENAAKNGRCDISMPELELKIKEWNAKYSTSMSCK